MSGKVPRTHALIREGRPGISRVAGMSASKSRIGLSHSGSDQGVCKEIVLA